MREQEAADPTSRRPDYLVSCKEAAVSHSGQCTSWEIHTLRDSTDQETCCCVRRACHPFPLFPSDSLQWVWFASCWRDYAIHALFRLQHARLSFRIRWSCCVSLDFQVLHVANMLCDLLTLPFLTELSDLWTSQSFSRRRQKSVIVVVRSGSSRLFELNWIENKVKENFCYVDLLLPFLVYSRSSDSLDLILAFACKTHRERNVINEWEIELNPKK